MKCVGGVFGVVAPILLVLLAFVVYWVLKRRGVLKEHHLKHFNLNMQTKLKQTTTVVQVLSEASKVRHSEDELGIRQLLATSWDYDNYGRNEAP